MLIAVWVCSVAATEYGISRLDAMLDESRYEDVLLWGADLLDSLRAADPAGSVAEAEILDRMVHACYRSKHVMDDEALAMARRAVAIKERLLEPHSTELATSLLHQANLYCRRWEAESAIPLYERVEAILARAGPRYDVQRASALSSHGVAYRRAGDSRRALALYEEALAIQEDAGNDPDPALAATINNMAVIRAELGDYRAAVRLYERALAIREAHFGPDHEWVGETLNNLASVLGYLGEYDRALAAQERAVAIFADQLGCDHQRHWWAKLNLGIAYLDMGDYAGAAPLCEEVLEGIRERYGAEHIETSYALDALAASHHGLGDHERALALYKESRRLAEAEYGAGDPMTADTMTQEGKCLLALGRLEDAAASLSLSLEIRENHLDGDSPVLCETLHTLADVYCRLGDHGRAAALADRSCRIARGHLSTDHPLLAEAYLLRARIAHARGESALAEALQAETCSRRHLQTTMRVLSEVRALDYAATRTVGLDLAVSQIADGERGERVAAVWDAVVRSRSAVLDEYAARNRDLAAVADLEAASLLSQSLALRERIANLTLRGPGWEDPGVYQQMLEDSHRELDTVERELSLVSARFRRDRDYQRIGYPEVTSALAATDALVAYVRFDREWIEATPGASDPQYMALVLNGAADAPVAIELGSAREIDRLVEAWQIQVRYGGCASDEMAAVGTRAARGIVGVPAAAPDRVAAYRQAAEPLARRVWRPLSALIAGARRVFVVPAGSLHLVNFAALPDDEGGYLVESDFLLHLLVSERSLAIEPGDPAPALHLLVVGDPDYEAETAARAASGADHATEASPEIGGFEPLPLARREAEAVATIWRQECGPVDLLVGADATERELKERLAGCRVLHLATHGFVIPGDGESGARSAPLSRSGLALSGANHWRCANPAADGILTAAEVAALDLSGVSWAVLSACDTGLGAIGPRGEGIFGLRRVFTLAGARTVIMSLWAVNDSDALAWMTALYQAHWRDGASSAEAVRLASRAVLMARREAGISTHPHHWAGFVAAGDWR